MKLLVNSIHICECMIRSQKNLDQDQARIQYFSFNVYPMCFWIKIGLEFENFNLAPGS